MLLFFWWLQAPFQERSLSRRYGEGYLQYSAYLSVRDSLSKEDLEALEQSLREEYPDGEDGRTGYVSAYSFETFSTVSAGDRTAETQITVVDGDFFQFQAIPLLSGSLFWAEEENTDLVVLDENLAWMLFGSVRISGMHLYLGDQSFLISGVVRENRRFADPAFYGGRPRLYMQKNAYEQWRKNTGNSAEGFTACQFLLSETLEDAFHNFLEEQFYGRNFLFVEEDSRFSLSHIGRVLSSYGKRNAALSGIELPYWESAARYAEDMLALCAVLLGAASIGIFCLSIKFFFLFFRKL